MDAKELAALGRNMRRKQSEYSRTPSPQILNECRDLERRFDRACDEVLQEASLPGLFDEPKP